MPFENLISAIWTNFNTLFNNYNTERELYWLPPIPIEMIGSSWDTKAYLYSWWLPTLGAYWVAWSSQLWNDTNKRQNIMDEL
jgi:hypothetical protein